MKMLLDDDRMALKDFVGSKFYCDGGWVLVENFEIGTKRKFEWGDVAESDFHAGFRFRVEDILKDV
ncbi:MAG: hypothetical protein LBL26_06725 [Peptococcaceae bacterium]|nr:hypothetical protein [Peptococcaceae bacterium]